MTREIKFRAWDKKKQVMFVVYDITFREDGSMRIIPIFPETEPDAILMQFTGLKDKNGKEIYEGDVILVPDEDVVPVTDEGQGPIEPCNHIVAVEFRNGEFGFEIPKTDDGETGWFTWRKWGEYSDPKEIEIIGNIYENTNLLK